MEENGEIVVEPTKQHIPGMELSDDVMEYRVTFGQVWISKPAVEEHDGTQEVRGHGSGWDGPRKEIEMGNGVGRLVGGARVEARRGGVRPVS